MNNQLISSVKVEIMPECENTETAQRIFDRFGKGNPESSLILRLDNEGLCLVNEDQILRADFTKMLPRIKAGRVNSELLVRASKIKGEDKPLMAVDATAGLGEDSLLLAASGFHVTMYEHNAVIYELLKNAIDRATEIPELAEAVSRMTVYNEDSVNGMTEMAIIPDVVLLDPMFPERQKSALVKKKLQMIQKLEMPCIEERTLLITAMRTKPKKLIVKRPPKGPYLADIKPDYSIEGKAVRFDCFVSPYDRIHKYDNED